MENGGGTGTTGSHWDKRVMGNEAMTGIIRCVRNLDNTVTPLKERLVVVVTCGWACEAMAL